MYIKSLNEPIFSFKDIFLSFKSLKLLMPPMHLCHRFIYFFLQLQHIILFSCLATLYVKAHCDYKKTLYINTSV